MEGGVARKLPPPIFSDASSDYSRGICYSRACRTRVVVITSWLFAVMAIRLWWLGGPCVCRIMYFSFFRSGDCLSPFGGDTINIYSLSKIKKHPKGCFLYYLIVGVPGIAIPRLVRLGRKRLAKLSKY